MTAILPSTHIVTIINKMEPTEVTVDAPTFQQQAVVIYSTSPHVIRTEAQKSCQRKLRGLAVSK